MPSAIGRLSDGDAGAHRDGAALDKKTKSVLSVGILAALGRFEEVEIYTKGALATGVTVNELKDVLTHVAVYCGTPTGRQAFLAAHKALQSAGSHSSRQPPS